MNLCHVSGNRKTVFSKVAPFIEYTKLLGKVDIEDGMLCHAV
jgi:hypothetical protein